MILLLDNLFSRFFFPFVLYFLHFSFFFFRFLAFLKLSFCFHIHAGLVLIDFIVFNSTDVFSLGVDIVWEKLSHEVC